MFQNATIARDHGKQITDKLIAGGVPERAAKLQGRMAEVKKLRQLNAWTLANVSTN